MIKALGWYLRNEVIPRLGSFLHWSSELWLAVLVGVVLGYWGGYLIPTTTTVGSVSIALLTYAAIALGFALAGLTLVLTLPNDNFVNLLCETKPDNKKHDSYADLIFVFSWTAITHWVIVAMSIGLVLMVNPQQPAFVQERFRLRSGLITGLSLYALLQFLVTLITLAQVGAAYIVHLKSEAQKRKDNLSGQQPSQRPDVSN